MRYVDENWFLVVGLSWWIKFIEGLVWPLFCDLEKSWENDGLKLDKCRVNDGLNAGMIVMISV